MIDFKRMLFGAAAVSLAWMVQPACADILTRKVDGVSRIEFKLPGELSVRYGAQESLAVEAEPKVLQKLDIAVNGDKLILGSKGSFKTDKGIKLTLTLKSFRSLLSEGSGNSVIEGFGGNDIDIDVAGTGDVQLNSIKAPRLGILIKGSGNVDAAGSGKAVEARIDGSGKIDTTEYRARSVQARINGSGEIRVHADEDLNATITGAGNIEYQGKAKVRQSITGAGSVDRI